MRSNTHKYEQVMFKQDERKSNYGTIMKWIVLENVLNFYLKFNVFIGNKFNLSFFKNVSGICISKCIDYVVKNRSIVIVL